MGAVRGTAMKGPMDLDAIALFGASKEFTSGDADEPHSRSHWRYRKPSANGCEVNRTREFGADAPGADWAAAVVYGPRTARTAGVVPA